MQLIHITRLFITALFLFAFSWIGQGQQVTVTYDNPVSHPGEASTGSSAVSTKNATANIPACATTVTAEAWGGGGGGAGCSLLNRGGGGGGGAYVKKNNFGKGGFSASIIIGCGGARGENNADGHDGCPSSVTYNGSTITAGPGAKGIKNNTGHSNGAGGAASGGDINTKGYDGDNGSGGGSPNGGGGGHQGSNGTVGRNGYNPGGGGSGGDGLASSEPGGHGGGGKVILSFVMSRPVIVGNGNIFCAGEALALSVEEPCSSAIYKWKQNGVEVHTGATFNISSLNTSHSGNYTVEYDYTYSFPSATSVAASGQGLTTNGSTITITSTGFTVTVNPLPVLNNITSQTLRAGDHSTAINFTGSNVNAATTTWVVTAGSGIAVGMSAESGTGNIASFTATNSGTKPLSATITVTPKSPLDCIGTVKTFTITVNPEQGSVIWTPEANNSEEKNNWHYQANWTPAVVPSLRFDVYIPGDRDSYPVLEAGNGGECKNIYFMQGAELGRPDLLTYEKAYVQYNFGLKQSEQQKDNNEDLVLESNNTTDRMHFSAAVSADPLARERWYMLSSPLRGVVTGDLGFGGFPLTFLMKFGPVFKDRQYEVGQWTTPYNSMTEYVSTNYTGQYIPTGGFAFYIYGWGNTSGNGNDGCYETCAFNNPSMNDLIYLPSTRNGEYYGLNETNGILELPFFADSTALYAHRTQVYNNPTSNTSTFFYINDGKRESANFNKLLGTSESVPREGHNGNYRFAPEYDSNGNGDWIFQNPINHPGTGLGGDDEFLVGNPYMSSIDMVKFLNDNTATIEPQFRIWNGTSFISYSISGGKIVPTYPPDNAINPGYVAPLQGFFLKTKTGYNGAGTVAKFDVTKISTTRPINNPSNLRSAAETKEENILRIKSDNGLAESYTLIGYREGASNAFVHGEDVQKLFSPLNSVPEIYSLAGETPIDINFINNGAIIPLGIKTERKGEIRLTFTGMDNYSKASKIELFDALENRTVDLTGKSSYTYTFYHPETGIQNGRFSLRVTASVTGLDNISNADDLNVYGDSKGIYVLSATSDPVQQITVYDFQGRKLYESNKNAVYYPLQGSLGHSHLIVKVTTENTTKIVKLGIK